MARPQGGRIVVGPVAIVGAGWTGAVVARQLHDAGVEVEVFERAANVGGHSRVETLNGVVYEPNGAHIFHTSNEQVATYVQSFGMSRPYEHAVLTQAVLADGTPVLLSWPPQVDELSRLPSWPQIRAELDALPPEPIGEDFETYVVSLMGPTLYEMFIYGYTVKQWGCEPSELSAKFAPKRVDLRRDGNRRLFRDSFEFFPVGGVNSIIESILAPVAVSCGVELGVADLAELSRSFKQIVITAPLDDFVGRPGELAWRGIRMRSRYVPTAAPDGTLTAAYVVNHPALAVPYTRTVETKHATGQQIHGTVVSEEHPGAPAKHYPVPTVDGRHERINAALQAEIAEISPMVVYFAGRLANYTYINQDQAIEQALATAQQILS